MPWWGGNPSWFSTMIAPPTQYESKTPQDQSKFMGYDFTAHEGQQFDTRNPEEGTKYAVSNYLSSIDPTTDWAEKAKNDLNKQFGSNIFSNQGGQRLSYGDEFVDSTKQAGKFFWGSNAPQMPQMGSMNMSGNGNLMGMLQDFFKQQQNNTTKNVMWQGSEKKKQNFGGSGYGMNSLNPTSFDSGYSSGLQGLGFRG